MITQTHRLDVVPGGVTAVVHVKQYQTGESLVFELFSRFGDFEISAAFTECTVRGTKSDGNGYSADATCDPSNNSVTVELTEQMTAVAGRQPYEITIAESTGRMITTTFILDVHRAALDADTVESESVIKEVQTIVEEYIGENPGLFVVDPTLTQSGEAADAKVAGDAIAALQSAISRGGMAAEVKAALLNCFENVAWANSSGQTYYDALEAALYPPVGIVSISAVYTQSGTVYDTDSLDSLKSDLVVTAHYDDDTSETVFNYTLTGTLTTGTSTITVSYGGKTDSFNVTVSEWTTSPAIAKTDTYWETNMQEATATGFCITEKYWYDLDMDALKATAKYDSTNDCFTVDGASLFGAFLCPNSQSISVGGRNKLVYFGGDNVAITYATMNFGSNESAFLSRKSSTQWTNIAQNKIGLSFTLITDDVENSYAYFKTTQSGVMPVGVSAGDIIFAGANTPYYGKTNIND